MPKLRLPCAIAHMRMRVSPYLRGKLKHTSTKNELKILFIIMSSSFLLISILLFVIPSFVWSVSVNTFEFVNKGPWGDTMGGGLFTSWSHEYDADYRALPIANFPYQLCFYNTTPNAFTLAIRMGLSGFDNPFDIRRWVWEANRGKPVREGAKLKLGADGNLVLIDTDGYIAWQTFTSNKSVVAVQLLNNGNLVLVDTKGTLVWQSFLLPTDTLLLGQSLKAGGVRKLVSRASDKENVNGPYSLVVQPTKLVMTYWSKKSRQPLVYYEFLDLQNLINNGVIFGGDLFNPDGQRLHLSTFGGREAIADLVLAKYNSTYSYLRLGEDGNLRIFTLQTRFVSGSWDVAFALFGNPQLSSLGSVVYPLESQCQLPEKCGDFGICEDNQCVACPTPNGLMGWSKDCQQPKLTSCNQKDFHYYKIEGVDHFKSKYNLGLGPMKKNKCGDICTKDCKCLGYFYHQENSLCWTASDLKTLTKTKDLRHVAYIKTPN